MMDTPLSPEEIDESLRGLPGWAPADGALEKTFVFGGFREAMGFMVRVAFDAEQLNHHPEWTNVYDRVRVRLSTHEAGDRVTRKDVELAGRIERAVRAG